MKFAALAALLIFRSTLSLAQTPGEIVNIDPVFSASLAGAASFTHVESIRVGDKQTEIVYLGNGETVELELDLKDEAIALATLPPELQAQVLEKAGELLELTTDLALSDKIADTVGATEENRGEFVTLKIEGSKARRFAVARDWVRARLTTGVMGNDKTLYQSAPKGLKANQKFLRFLKLAWQFALVETVHAAIEYYDEYKAAPKMVEFGLSFDLKVEPQIFIGKFNPTQRVKALRNSYGLALEISFDKKRMRPAIRTRLRREKGSGGLGLPAAKAEIKFFQTDGTHGVQSGKSWYPISPPVASFVLDRDSHGHYFAQGLTVGVNMGDLIPGSTLTNTFADYQQKEDPIDFQHLPETATHIVHKAARAVTSHRAQMCSQLFQF